MALSSHLLSRVAGVTACAAALGGCGAQTAPLTHQSSSRLRHDIALIRTAIAAGQKQGALAGITTLGADIAHLEATGGLAGADATVLSRDATQLRNKVTVQFVASATATNPPTTTTATTPTTITTTPSATTATTPAPATTDKPPKPHPKPDPGKGHPPDAGPAAPHGHDQGHRHNWGDLLGRWLAKHGHGGDGGD